MPTWIWTVVLIALLAPVFVRMVIWFTMRGLRLQPGAHRRAAEAEVPEWESATLRGADAVLEAQGFRFVAYGWMREGIAGHPCERFVGYYGNEAASAWAAVKVAHCPVPQCPFLIEYFTAFADGRLLNTRNLDTRMGEEQQVPWQVVQDLFVDSWDKAWDLHRKRAEELAVAAPVAFLPLDRLIALRNGGEAEAWTGWHESGKVERIGEDLGRLRPRAALALAMIMGDWARSLNQGYAAWMKKAETFPLPTRAEASAFARTQRIAPDVGGWGKGILLVASLLAFSVVLGQDFSVGLVAALVLVILVHELGHALVMRWVGYRDVNIFFIPFFGAMATGRPRGLLHPWQEALVLLAGPVPGLILGAWMFPETQAQGGFLHQVATMALGLNAINLLPVSPLDGGRLMDLMLFRRAPRLGFGFLLASGAALAIGAFYFQDAILGLLAAGVLLSSRRTYRQAVMLAEWRKQREGAAAAAGPEGEESLEDRVEPIFQRLRQEKPMEFRHKVGQVKALLSALPTRVPGLGSAFGMLCVYGCAWLAAFVVLALPRGGQAARVAEAAPEVVLDSAEQTVFDGICADTAVAHVGLRRREDTLSYVAFTRSAEDTPGVRARAGLPETGARRLLFRARLWSVGAMDSSLFLPPAYFLDGGSDDADLARLEAGLDSLARLEDSLWTTFPPDRRLAVLGEARKRSEKDGFAYRCWKW